MSWQTDYPTVADVATAHIDTVIQWHDNLPEPQTAVEHTVRRKLMTRIKTHAETASDGTGSDDLRFDSLRATLGKAEQFRKALTGHVPESWTHPSNINWLAVGFHLKASGVDWGSHCGDTEAGLAAMSGILTEATSLGVLEVNSSEQIRLRST
ncbi:MAG: hypothetical protein ACR2QC_00665 [Gammaproteobacteria bacterium]